MGAVFPEVPAIKLTQVGGGLVQFDDTTDADATAEDIAKNKTAYVNGVKITGTASGGGGPSNIVTGTFLFDDSVANSAQTINLPYEGDGFPVAVMVYPPDGTTVLSLQEMYPLTLYMLARVYTQNGSPVYSGDSSRDLATVVYRYRNNRSTSNGGGNIALYDDSREATNASSCSIMLHSDNTMSVYALQAGASSGYGFRCGIRYTYVVVYSE